MRRGIAILLAMLLIFSSFSKLEKETNAATPYKYQILEIIDNGSSQMASQLDRTKYDVTTIRMKRFVALRDELIGKYDAIILSKGTYNPAVVFETTDNNREASHNTANVMNDITNLRAGQLKDFVKEKYLLLMDSSSITNQADYKLVANGPNQTGKLKAQFSSYQSNNFSKFSTPSEAKTLLEKYLAENGKLRPAFTLPTKPVEYRDGNTVAYKRGENVNFGFNVINLDSLQGKEYRATLYIDSDFNDQYTPAEQVVTKKIASLNDTIQYGIPMGYSGIRYWKLEILDEGTGLRTYQKGNFRVQDVPVKINVLQVRKDTDPASKLTTSTNMNQTYLKRDNDYEITIADETMSNFNNDIVHTTLNGKYNMLVFGFADVYNNANITTNAVTSLKNYIRTKQSVMFTHDTMIGKANNWVDNFKEENGQNYLYTNLGYGARKSSTRTQKVNDGLLTQYPFVDTSSGVQIANTHNQYYALNLEDSETIPWYNIIDKTDNEANPRDYDDSWNHYYTYSKGSVTYSGTGHTSAGFPDGEQKLFVNTMYRAFLGANKAPLIDVMAPTANSEVPTNQDVQISYQLDDLDLKDTTVTTRILFNGVEVMAPTVVPNHSIVTRSIPHGFTQNGNLTVTIEAWDKDNAKEIKTIPVKIIKLVSSLEVSRAFKDNVTKIPVNEVATIRYTITPKTLLATDVTHKLGNVEFFELKNVQWSETFPANVQVAATNGITVSGNNASMTIPSIRYTKNGSNFTASPITFEMNVTPTTKGNIAFSQSTLTYTDYTKVSYTLAFNPLYLESDYAITSISLPEVIVIPKGNSRNLLPYLQINPSTATANSIEFIKKDSSTAITLINGVATGIEDGSSSVEAVVTDKFGRVFRATTTLYVRVPLVSMSTSDVTLYVGEEKTVPLTISPVESYSGLTIENANSTVASFDKGKRTVTGLKEGVTTLTFKGYQDNGTLLSVPSKITVLPSEVVVNPKEVEMYVNESKSFTVTTKPANLPYTFKGYNDAMLTIANGTITARNPGITTVSVEADLGTGKDAMQVRVWTMLPKATVYIRKGSEVSVNDIANYAIDYLGGFAPSIEERKVTNIKDDYYLGYNETYNMVYGKKLGKTKFTIGHVHTNGKTYPIELNVIVTDRDTPSSSMPWY